MKLEVTVSEIADIFKEIQERPGQLFEMIRLDIREVVGKYLTTMMNAELTHYLGRDPYVRVSGAVNHRNGSYGRGFALKGVGEVHVDVPRDRKGEFKTSVIPRSKQYEEEVARDFSILNYKSIRGSCILYGFIIISLCQSNFNKRYFEGYGITKSIQPIATLRLSCSFYSLSNKRQSSAELQIDAYSEDTIEVTLSVS